MAMSLRMVIFRSEKSGSAGAGRAAARPAAYICRNAGSGRAVHQRAESGDGACRALRLHDEKRSATEISAWYKQEARRAGERVQFVGKAVRTKGGVVAGKPAAMRCNCHLLHVPQRSTFTSLGYRCAGSGCGLAGGEHGEAREACQTGGNPHAATPSTLSKSARPSLPPCNDSMRFSGCGISPSTLPSALTMPAMSLIEPFGLVPSA